MAENGKYIIKADANLALSQIGAAFSIVGEKIRDCFIMLFPGRSEASYKRLIDNTLKQWEYAQEVIEKRKIPPALRRQLSDKFGDAWIKQAPLEDDETLQRAWANLLANAQDPDYKETDSLTVYQNIIKDLSPLNVRSLLLLRKLAATGDEVKFPSSAASPFFAEFKRDLDPNAEEIERSIDNLLHLRLISITKTILVSVSPDLKVIDGGSASNNSVGVTINSDMREGLAPSPPYFTSLGTAFLRACMPDF
jgi:hypothetical protein